MIPVTRVPEPPDFDEQTRQPGRQWLRTHPETARPRDFWSPFRSILAEGFHNRCGYSAMYDLVGTVDHFRSVKHDRALAYEWTNYRYASQWINSSKKVQDVLDPHEVGEGWFEIILPSLQLVLTDKVPAEFRARAEFTLNNLPLVHDERILKQRRAWFSLYEKGELTLDGLRHCAPLIAAAVERHQAVKAKDSSPLPSQE